MRLLAEEIGHFLYGVRSLTNIPSPVVAEDRTGRLARAARYFPLVGVLVGLVAGLVFLIASSVTGPVIGAGLAMAVGLGLSGADSETGLAATVDGLGPEGAGVETGKKVALGAPGATALVISVGLRWIALASFAPFEGLIALILAHSVSRGMLAPVLISGHFARSPDLAGAVASGVRGAEALIALLLSLAIAMIGGLAVGLMAVAAGAVSAGLALAFVMLRYRGYSFYSLGAIQQVGEIGILVALSAALR